LTILAGQIIQFHFPLEMRRAPSGEKTCSITYLLHAFWAFPFLGRAHAF